MSFRSMILTVLGIWFSGHYSLAEPPKPAQMSREELEIIFKNLPGEMCEIRNGQLVFRDSVNSVYNIFLGNPSDQLCELTFKVWRKELSTFPDGSPAPSGFYEMKTEIVKGSVALCRCR